MQSVEFSWQCCFGEHFHQNSVDHTGEFWFLHILKQDKLVKGSARLRLHGDRCKSNSTCLNYYRNSLNTTTLHLTYTNIYELCLTAEQSNRTCLQPMLAHFYKMHFYKMQRCGADNA